MQPNRRYKSIKVQGNTIVIIPSESLNSMGFGNLAMTVAYLENTKKAAKGKQIPLTRQQKQYRMNRAPLKLRFTN